MTKSLEKSSDFCFWKKWPSYKVDEEQIRPLHNKQERISAI